MNPNTPHSEQKSLVTLSHPQYAAIINTNCGGKRLVETSGFKPKLSEYGTIYWAAQLNSEDAEAVYDWADFCYRG